MGNQPFKRRTGVVEALKHLDSDANGNPRWIVTVSGGDQGDTWRESWQTSSGKCGYDFTDMPARNHAHDRKERQIAVGDTAYFELSKAERITLVERIPPCFIGGQGGHNWSGVPVYDTFAGYGRTLTGVDFGADSECPFCLARVAFRKLPAPVRWGVSARIAAEHIGQVSGHFTTGAPAFAPSPRPMTDSMARCALTFYGVPGDMASTVLYQVMSGQGSVTRELARTIPDAHARHVAIRAHGDMLLTVEFGAWVAGTVAGGSGQAVVTVTSEQLPRIPEPDARLSVAPGEIVTEA